MTKYLEPGEACRALIFDIQRYSLHDGPGIRTLVFFKGCPLKCLWCSNPESQNTYSEVMYDERICRRCGVCIETCPNRALSFGTNGLIEFDRRYCNGCGFCARACNFKAITLVGKWMSVDEVIREILRDLTFYKCSGGGATLGGGEPLRQPDFVFELLERCKELHIHTAIETAGLASWDTMQKLVPLLDLIYYDIKQIDPDKHKRLTGVDNLLIQRNLSKLAKIHPNITVRYPLIKGYNDAEEDLLALTDWVNKYMPVPVIELSPYHGYGQRKYQMLWKSYSLQGAVSPSRDEIEKALELINSCGVNCSSMRF